MAGGEPGGTTAEDVETWNGSAWSEESDLTTAKTNGASGGTSTATLVFGGGPGQQTKTEEWDGSSWTEIGDLPSGKSAQGASKGGTTSAMLSFAGNPGALHSTEEFDVGQNVKVITD